MHSMKWFDVMKMDLFLLLEQGNAIAIKVEVAKSSIFRLRGSLKKGSRSLSFPIALIEFQQCEMLWSGNICFLNLK